MEAVVKHTDICIFTCQTGSSVPEASVDPHGTRQLLNIIMRLSNRPRDSLYNLLAAMLSLYLVD